MQSVERKRAGRDNEHRSSDRNIFDRDETTDGKRRGRREKELI